MVESIDPHKISVEVETTEAQQVALHSLEARQEGLGRRLFDQNWHIANSLIHGPNPFSEPILKGEDRANFSPQSVK